MLADLSRSRHVYDSSSQLRLIALVLKILGD